MFPFKEDARKLFTSPRFIEYCRERGLDAREAAQLAVLLATCHHYGKGDAYAGFQLNEWLLSGSAGYIIRLLEKAGCPESIARKVRLIRRASVLFAAIPPELLDITEEVLEEER